MAYKSVMSEIPPILKLEQCPRLGSSTGHVCEHGCHRAETFFFFSYPHKYMDSFAWNGAVLNTFLYTTPLRTYLFTLKICRVGLYTELSSLPCSPFFAILLSLHLIPFFSLV